MAADVASDALQAFMSRGWEEVRVLGSGALGPVLLVNRLDGSERSALKRSTMHEVKALMELHQCQHVVSLREHFSGCADLRQEDAVWARLECLEAGTLRTLVRARLPGKVPDVTARFLISEVLAGLDELHSRGWMHRDVKAENIGLSTLPGSAFGQHSEAEVGCRVKLLDFDSAVQVTPGCELSEVIGTVENMAPEVYEGSYDERADLWSLGVVAYELLFGYRPFNDACVDHVEEMVRNWQRYLVLPFDAEEAPSAFVRSLLSERRDRPSSWQASQHTWLTGSSSPSAKQGAASVQPCPCPSPLPINAGTWTAPPREREYHAARETTSAPSQDRCDGDPLKRLAGIRSSLQEWNAQWDAPTPNSGGYPSEAVQLPAGRAAAAAAAPKSEPLFPERQAAAVGTAGPSARARHSMGRRSGTGGCGDEENDAVRNGPVTPCQAQWMENLSQFAQSSFAACGVKLSMRRC
eukprot:gnl/TRDRNA2_/TRDRNA2_35425_c0_seq1.p1 gnl/TRDRNA2_/TRDRNA2_35425_c0~~gnl/TRDRNA2_/TRDRNA2_35425_c0_seq1.p1  ORF type:complete len:493 (-),score=54.01 gnl/TRDRNA2_/TRDRNA2_35425_c0_seq1:58-1455(-)